MPSTNSHVGSWTLNSPKSTFSPALPVPKSATVTIDVLDGRLRAIVDIVLADASLRHWEYTAHEDGKDNPVTGDNPDANTAVTRINPRTLQVVSKKNGKVTITQTSAVSTDGTTLTLTTAGVNAAGQTVNTMSVWDKQ